MHPPRNDEPGADWMITNRGIAKRAVFETRQDVERFCAALEEVVALGLLEVHAFVFMTTHFHLLVSSIGGEISRAMKLVANAYVRWFNRSRRRDGPLFARRFHSRRVRDPGHWTAALHYIDLNPIRARMCRLPSDHPYGSARAFRFEEGPEWLARERVIRAVTEVWAPRPYDAARYDEFSCAVDERANAYIIERLARFPDRSAPPLADLIRTAGLRQQAWMEWKAALADGMSVGTAFLPPEEALRAARVVTRRLARDPLPARAATTGRDLAAGLLRTTSGLRVTEIATQLGVARSTAQAAIKRHDAWMGTSPLYAERVARALQTAVRRALGPRRHPLELPRRVGSVDPGDREPSPPIDPVSMGESGA